MKLEEYYNSDSNLYEDIEELISIDKTKVDEINVLVLNAVIKYATSYMFVGETNISTIKSKIHSIVDQSPKAIWLSKDILSKLSWDYQFKWSVWNILDDSTYKNIPLYDINYIVSETISNTTPPFWIDTDDWELLLYWDYPEGLMEKNMNADPFPYVISKLTELDSDLYQKIKYWKVWMFPNYPNKLYTPDFDKTTIDLKTSWFEKPLNLANIWKEFDKYEDLWLPFQRWEEKDERWFDEFKKMLSWM